MNKQSLFLICLVLSSILFGVMNYNPNKISDVYLYQFQFVDKDVATPKALWSIDTTQRVSNVRDIIKSQYYHYRYQNGRCIVSGLTQLFVGILNPIVYAIFSGLIFFFFILYLSKVSLGYLKTGTCVSFLPFLVFFLLYCEPRCICDCAYGMNYLFSTTLCLVFYYHFVTCFHFKTKTAILMCIFAFFTAWTNEAIVIPISVALLCHCAFNIKSYPLQKYLIMLFWGAGAMIMIFAPANFIRMSNDPLTLVSALYMLMLSRLFCCFLVFAAVLFIFKRPLLINWVHEQRAMVISLFVSFLFFMCIPDKPERTGFGVDIISVILIVSLLDELVNRRTLHILNYIAQFIVVLLFVSILFCDSIASDEYGDLMHQISDCDEPICEISLRKSKIPAIMIPYTSRSGLDTYYWWLACVWGVEYHKTVVITPDGERLSFYTSVRDIYRYFKKIL